MKQSFPIIAAALCVAAASPALAKKAKPEPSPLSLAALETDACLREKLPEMRWRTSEGSEGSEGKLSIASEGEMITRSTDEEEREWVALSVIRNSVMVDEMRAGAGLPSFSGEPSEVAVKVSHKRFPAAGALKIPGTVKSAEYFVLTPFGETYGARAPLSSTAKELVADAITVVTCQAPLARLEAEANMQNRLSPFSIKLPKMKARRVKSGIQLP